MRAMEWYTATPMKAGEGRGHIYSARTRVFQDGEDDVVQVSLHGQMQRVEPVAVQRLELPRGESRVGREREREVDEACVR